MTKYKYTRKQIAGFINDNHGWHIHDDAIKMILAKNEESKCEHEHLSCPEGIKTVRCAYCGKGMYKEPTPSEPIKLEEIKQIKPFNYEIYGVNQEPAIKFSIGRTNKKLEELIDWSHQVNKILKGNDETE